MKTYSAGIKTILQDQIRVFFQSNIEKMYLEFTPASLHAQNQASYSYLTCSNITWQLKLYGVF